MSAELSTRLGHIRQNIAKASAYTQSNGNGVKLICVSKMQEDNEIEAALGAGLRVFGENRVQEAQKHWGNRRAAYPDLELHLIGPLQTNKADDAVALFDVIETIDRSELADAIAKACSKMHKNPLCFIQVNTGSEPQKSGVSIDNLPDLLQHCRNINLGVKGLMCIPPVDEPPAFHFSLLKKLAARHNLPYLSMGMSGDYERAIEAGATHIRLGTALFGDRKAV